MDEVFRQSKAFFSLGIDDKLAVKADKNNRGFTPMHEEILDPAKQIKGDTKVSNFMLLAPGCSETAVELAVSKLVSIPAALGGSILRAWRQETLARSFRLNLGGPENRDPRLLHQVYAEPCSCSKIRRKTGVCAHREFGEPSFGGDIERLAFRCAAPAAPVTMDVDDFRAASCDKCPPQRGAPSNRAFPPLAHRIDQS